MKLRKNDILTIPNILSLFRLILAVLILWIFYDENIGNQREILLILLLVSALTDFLDGKIARKFHMVSELGKVLDPIADKVTQGILLICFLSKYPVMWGVFILFLVKEGYMAVAGMRVMKKTMKNEGAMWYGKVNTAVFYIVIFLLVFVPDISQVVANALIMITSVFMLLSLGMYIRKYRKIIKNV